MTENPAPGFRLLTEAQIEEIASRAWQNVAAYSTEYTPLTALASFSDLGVLPEEQLEYRARLQFLLSDELRAFLLSAKKIMVRLAQTTELHVSEGRSPIGYIDWPATITSRLSAGRDSSMYVLRRSEVHRDLPENRLLKFLLNETARLAREVLGGRTDSGWQAQIEVLRRRTDKLANGTLLRSIPAEFGRSGYLAAKASRVPGYREVARAYELYDSLFRRGDQKRLLDLFRQRVLVPQLEDRAFELLVLFRTIEFLEASGAQRLSMRLIGQGEGPRFVFETADTLLNVYFQGMPASLRRRSLYRRYMTAAALGPGTRRPDIVVQVRRKGSPERIVLIEAKCSTFADTIRDGGFQLLGYLSDFKLYKEAGTVLMLVAYGGITRYTNWPDPMPIPPFIGCVSDLDGLLDVLATVLN